MASTFKHSEKFRVTMVNAEGSSERVTIQLSLDGLKVLNQDGSRTMRSYNLRNVSRWDLMDTSTVIWTKTDVDLEERPLTLSSDSTTIRNVVDTLASCCMQLAEVIQDRESDHAAASNLQELAAGGGKTRKAAKLPSVDSVEYWRSPDKAGWLQSQSEVMKMWRRRWFVLKQGYLFRFLSPDVSESVKPRGVVDLSKVQDVRDGRAVTGKANTVQLKTASGGSVCYVCESETEMVEWISALEGAIAKIVKQLAGVDDNHSSSSERHSHRSSSSRDRQAGGTSSSSSASKWAEQMERSLSQSSSRRGNANGNTMVSVVGYPGGGGGGAGGGSSSGSGGARASAPSAAYDDYGGISNYSQISGAAGVAAALDDLTLNYGGYPRAGGGAPGGTAGPAAGGGSGGGYGSYGAAVPAAYGGSGSSGANAYGSGSSGTNAYGGGSGAAAAPGAYSGANAYGYGSSTSYGSSSYPDGSSNYYGSSGYGEPAAAGANGYGSAHQQPGGGYQAPAAAAAGYDGYYQQQQQQQPPQQQQPAVSLMDQVPSQQPAYPYYQPTSQAAGGQEAAAPPPPAPPSSWQVHHTAEGRPYYYNAATGTTQWEAPPGM